MNGYDGKPIGLWYAFDNLWLEYTSQDKSNFPEYNTAFLLKLDMNDILVIHKPETLKLFVQQYELPTQPDRTSSFSGEHLLPSGRINWQRVAEHYKGIEFPELFGGYGAPWFRGMDVSGGCIWDVSAIVSIKEIALSEL